jgi:hypothetical protein
MVMNQVGVSPFGGLASRLKAVIQLPIADPDRACKIRPRNATQGEPDYVFAGGHNARCTGFAPTID